MRPAAHIRSTRLLPEHSLYLALAVAASAALGAIVVKSTLDAVALLVIGVAAATALTRPAFLFAAGILLLAIEPTKIFGEASTAGRPETFKLVLYACTIPLLLSRGINRKKCAPLVAYGLVTVLTKLLGTPLPGLTTKQTAASLATLCLGWLVFAINWDWRRDHRLLKAFTWVPMLSLLAGVVLQAAGILMLFRDSTPPRLEGATIAAWLGALGLYSAIACLVLYRREQWRPARWLGSINVLILGATLTRGAILALAIVAIPPLTRFIRHQLSLKGATGLAKLAIATVVAIAGAAALISGIIERNENAGTYDVARSAVTHEIASGRLQAWSFVYKQAKVNLAFGRGIGAGPLAGKITGSPEGFTAQHNEYLRMLLEDGIIGGVILLGSIVTTFFSTIRRAPASIRTDLAASAIAFAVFAVTENTLSAAPLAVAFLLMFGIACSRASPPPLAIKGS
jgi:teichuronic acid biosynthesis protein TuaE